MILIAESPSRRTEYRRYLGNAGYNIGGIDRVPQFLDKALVIFLDITLLGPDSPRELNHFCVHVFPLSNFVL